MIRLAETGGGTPLYRLKITLRDCKPPIWRRVVVRADMKLDHLHRVIQIAMGWTDSHLHQFVAGGTYYGQPDREGDAEMLNENEAGEPADANRQGLARELARMNLTLNTYTQWYWKTDLHNLLHFLSLRADAHAQYEIRVYADAMLDTVKRWVPLTFEAFMDYRMGGVQLSAAALAVVKRLLAGEAVDPKQSGLSPREWRELMQSLGRDGQG